MEFATHLYSGLKRILIFVTSNLSVTETLERRLRIRLGFLIICISLKLGEKRAQIVNDAEYNFIRKKLPVAV